MPETLAKAEIVQALQGFVAESLLFISDPAACAPSASLSAAGVLDSTAILELVEFIEDQFDLEIDLMALRMEIFDTIDTIADYVLQQLAEGAANRG
jgi:acyl carrier protein